MKAPHRCKGKCGPSGIGVGEDAVAGIESPCTSTWRLPADFSGSAADNQPYKTYAAALAAYLYSGITAVKSFGDPLDAILKSSKAW